MPEPVHPSYVGHFGLRTRPENFEAMIDWHVKFFGSKVVLKNNVAAFLTYDHEHHRLVIINDPDFKPIPSPGSTCGIYHIAFTLDSLEALATSYEEKKAHGILPHWPVNHGISTSMYYFDPDGNEFEMQVDNFASAQDVYEFMETSEFKENPIGVDFVPEEFVKRVRSGEDEASIKKRPVIGPRLARWQNSIYFKPDGKWRHEK
ncbi:uncharacterized protein Z520_11271 [Fonsecaea multimorphosa CBS 102226]|uniref:VOC domain-containing protein n=1 Tax=Fonsecaea multimorphosa CBS 102226 TaxID=1442371 RepID=A0A0D2K9D2_9EURO|nr:uncharacterized protein Z520_11271 [Fonsecaea multimorphosa CBS 102226]KIX92998.1 hypothetical protein Z520_11271 [Fonsecaea multimorphosa CBS 102226]OAL18246.1 hypothetical protein AYO22_10824 [Fonsecaea multimorphosa]